MWRPQHLLRRAAVALRECQSNDIFMLARRLERGFARGSKLKTGNIANKTTPIDGHLPPKSNKIKWAATVSRSRFATSRSSPVLRYFPQTHPVGGHDLAPGLLNVFAGFIVGQMPED
jgi:hypothetical protein